MNWTPCPKCIGMGSLSRNGMRRICRKCNGKGWLKEKTS